MSGAQAMADNHPFPSLMGLHAGEETVRSLSVKAILADKHMTMHFEITEAAMDVIDVFRQSPGSDGDQLTLKLLGYRIFNAFASSSKLMLSGYYQTGAMVLRDALETLFLLDYFDLHPPKISHWATCDDKTRKNLYKPVAIRDALDARDGFTSMKRRAAYQELSNLAGHPSPDGFAMLHPNGTDAHLGPFFDLTALRATAAELGRMAAQAGSIIGVFFPDDWIAGRPTLARNLKLTNNWAQTFYRRRSAEKNG